MPTRFIPLSEDEQKFGKLIDRVFTDEAFAKAMRTDAVSALETAGYHLTPAQAHVVKAGGATTVAAADPDVAIAFPLTKPLVNIITRGTKPAVRVATKGTQPVVSVAINSVVSIGAAPPDPAKTEPLSAKEVAQKFGHE
jgi:hypothetical protein